jgi:hypothetical protein
LKKIALSISLLLILALAFTLSGCSTPTPAATTTQVTNPLDRIAAAEARLSAVETAIGKVNAPVDTKAITDTANNAVSTANSAKATANEAKTGIDALQKSINDQKAQLDSLNTKLTQLLATSTPTPTSSNPSNPSSSTSTTSTLGKVTLKVTSYSGTIIPQGTFDFAGNTYAVASIDINSGGSGYTIAPTFRISGGTGSGATAHAILGTGTLNTSVVSIIVDSPGSGYINTAGGRPTIEFINNSFGAGSSASFSINNLNMAFTTQTTDPTITLKLTNAESYDINNLIFDLYLNSDQELNSSNIATKMKLVGTNATFRSIYSDSQEFDFESSGNGLSILAGKTKYVYITPTITLKNVINDADVNFIVTAKIIDFSS